LKEKPETDGTKSASSSGLVSGMNLVAALVLLIAVILGVAYNSLQDAAPPSIKPTVSLSIPKNVSLTLTPSVEMSRGEPNTLQNELYKGLEPAVLLVLNEDNRESPVSVFWNKEVKAIAPAGSRCRLETFVGHQFTIQMKNSVVSVTMDAPLIVFKSKAGSLDRVQVSDESQIPPLTVPPLPIVPLSSTAKAIKVRNLSGKRFNSYWIPPDGSAPVYQGVVEPNSESTTASYLTHTFRFVDLQDKTKIVFEFSVRRDQEIYAYIDEKTADTKKLRSHLEEVEFAAAYKRKHDGRVWLSYYPHGPVKSFMWPADYIGQEHQIFTEFGPDEKPLNFTLKVVSVRPRVFIIDYLISDKEAASIIESAKDKLRRSSVELIGADGEIVESNTRTSQNAWLQRGPPGSILDNVYRRVADVLNLNESILQHDPPFGAAEHMQVVHYKNSAHYAPHHDWGVRGGPHTRLATVLLYLNDPPRGGETAFPLAKVGKSEGLIVEPKKGQAVLFYSQFPDGNVDDESLHEARPTTKGEKWLANVWVHDKAFWGKDHEK